MQQKSLAAEFLRSGKTLAPRGVFHRKLAGIFLLGVWKSQETDRGAQALTKATCQGDRFRNRRWSAVKWFANPDGGGEIILTSNNTIFAMNKFDGNSGSEERESRDQCQIYAGSPSRQLPAMAVTIQRRLEEGYRCLYLNSRPMVTGIRSALAALGMDVGCEVAKARLVLSSEPVTTASGGFDVDLMLSKR